MKAPTTLLLIGIPAGLFQYIHITQSERRERREKLYGDLNERFIEYQRLCLQYPRLDVADYPRAAPEALTPTEEHQEKIMMVILFNLFESAYLLYKDGDRKSYKTQWPGWDGYIRFYMSRPNFLSAWQAGMPTMTGGEHTFDADFETYMNTVCAQVAQASQH
jgi:hypothetical protein